MFKNPDSIDFAPLLSKTEVKIGLLGGSFNPAHDGHLYISLEALKRLQLKEIWWLVSPHNPLKDPKILMDYETRLNSARKIARNPKIRVMDIERKFGTNYTIDTLTRLTKKYRNCHFTWIMGADNLQEFHRWKKWKEIPSLADIIVFDRNNSGFKSLKSPTARYIKQFVRIRKNPLSATELRALSEHNK